MRLDIPPRHRPALTTRSTRAVAGAVAEVMGNADLVRCVLGHALAGIDEFNARALAAATWGWPRVSRAHWDACRRADDAWEALTRRHFGRVVAPRVPNDARANFYALCRKAQNDHMGLPVFLRFDVEGADTLAHAMLEQEHGHNYSRDQPDSDFRVRGWRIKTRITARHVLRLLAWHPHGKYTPYDVKGMVAYFLCCRDIGPPGTTEAYPFYHPAHKMGVFLFPNHVTDWQSLTSNTPRALSARKYLQAVRKMHGLLALFRAECA